MLVGLVSPSSSRRKKKKKGSEKQKNQMCRDKETKRDEGVRKGIGGFFLFQVFLRNY